MQGVRSWRTGSGTPPIHATGSSRPWPSLLPPLCSANSPDPGNAIRRKNRTDVRRQALLFPVSPCDNRDWRRNTETRASPTTVSRFLRSVHNGPRCPVPPGLSCTPDPGHEAFPPGRSGCRPGTALQPGLSPAGPRIVSPVVHGSSATRWHPGARARSYLRKDDDERGVSETGDRPLRIAKRAGDCLLEFRWHEASVHIPGHRMY